MQGMPFVLLQNSRDEVLLLLKQSVLSFLGEILPFCSLLGWNTSYEGQLRILESLSLEKRLKRDLTRKEVAMRCWSLFSDTSDRKQPQVASRKKFLMERVAGHWNRLPWEWWCPRLWTCGIW